LHAQAASWGDLLDERWWREVDMALPKSPSPRAVALFASDALTGASSLPPLLSATVFSQRVEAAFRGTAAEASASLSGAPPPGSPLAALALHMIKLETPHAIAVLWRAFTASLAQEHCQAGVQVGTAAWRREASRPSEASTSYLHLWLMDLDASIAGRRSVRSTAGVSDGGRRAAGDRSFAGCSLPGIREEPAALERSDDSDDEGDPPPARARSDPRNASAADARMAELAYEAHMKATLAAFEMAPPLHVRG